VSRLLVPIVLVGCSPEAEDTPAGQRTDTGQPADTGDSGDSGTDSGDTADTGATPTWDEETDVVIIGAGVAGLAATIDAAAAGADVVLFERDDTVGGAARLSGGLMLFSGTPEQAEAGVEDSPAILASEWPTFTGGDPADPWFQFFANENVPRVRDWLAGFGVSWGQPGGDVSSGTTDRLHAVNGGGKALTDALLVASPPDVLRLNAEVTELVWQEGRAVGVRWADDDGEHTLRAGAIVVTTGGFLRDLDRVAAVLPELPLADATFASAPGADGNGLDMLEALGAATENLQAIGFYAHGTHSPAGAGAEVGTRDIGLYPWVNLDAARFADEWGTNSFVVGRTRAFQPGGYAWLVGDGKLATVTFLDLDGGPGAYDVVDLEAAGIAVQADSLDALAGELGVDRTALADTVEGWNRAARGEATDPWRAAGAPRGQVVEVGPFHAVPVATSLAKNFGGVSVDLDGRVLDTTGSALPGLYAAGELTGMCGGSIVGDYGFTGSLSCVILGGRVAGEAAAGEALAGGI
jgi:predicted oxidoreductase